MLSAFIESLNAWNTTKNERQKLQHALLFLTALIVLVAGIAGLFNADTGHAIVKVALFTLAAFAANAVVWNLLQSSLLDKLSSRPKRR